MKKFYLGVVLTTFASSHVSGCSGELLRYRTKMWHQCQKDLDKERGSHESTTRRLKTSEAHLNALAEDKFRLKKQLNESEKENKGLKTRIEQDLQRIAELNRQKEAMKKRSQLFRSLALKLREMIEAGNLKVVIRKGRMIVNMSDKILFSAGKAKLKTEGQAALKKLAAALKEIKDRDFVVAGHTDNQPVKYSVYRSNWELSVARAVAVTKFLQDEGMDPKRLSAAGYGQYDPVGDNTKPEGQAANRRIEIIVMPNISELPPVEPLAETDASRGACPSSPFQNSSG